MKICIAELDLHLKNVISDHNPFIHINFRRIEIEIKNC